MGDGGLHFLEYEYNLIKLSTSMIVFPIIELHVNKYYVNVSIRFILYGLINLFIHSFIVLLSIYLLHMKNDGMSGYGRNHNHRLLRLCETPVTVNKFHNVGQSPPPLLHHKRKD